MIDLDKLEELAKRATPGPWEADAHSVWAPGDYLVAQCEKGSDNHAFIAAANPQAVMELIEEIHRLRAYAKAMSDPATRFGR